MTIPQIAHRLTELCNQGNFEAAQKELFAEDVISIEPESTVGFEKETKGLQGVLEKGKQFASQVQEVHGCGTSDPIVAGNAIAFSLNMDITMKGKERSTMSEICLYHVKDGKIISEQFFW